MSAPVRGVLLRRTLDERSPTWRFDARALQQELEALGRAVSPAKLLTAVRRRGSLVEVAVVTARAERVSAELKRPAAATLTAWRPSW